MANYYALSQFGFKVKAEHAPIVTEAYSLFSEPPAKLMKLVTQEKIDPETIKALEPAMRIALEALADHQDIDYYKREFEGETWEDDTVEMLNPGFDLMIEHKTDDENHKLVVIGADESINDDHAAVFVSAVLAEFDMPDVVPINVAYTCDKDRLDAFGGAVTVVTKDSITFEDGTRLIDAERKAAENNVDYYLGTITDVNGESEYSSKVIKVVPKGADAKAAFRDLLINDWNGAAESVDEENDLVWFEDGKATRLSVDVQKIKPIEYATLSMYLPVH